MAATDLLVQHYPALFFLIPPPSFLGKAKQVMFDWYKILLNPVIRIDNLETQFPVVFQSVAWKLEKFKSLLKATAKCENIHISLRYIFSNT
jgi:hypothetical protein